MFNSQLAVQPEDFPSRHQRRSLLVAVSLFLQPGLELTGLEKKDFDQERQFWANLCDLSQEEGAQTDNYFSSASLFKKIERQRHFCHRNCQAQQTWKALFWEIDMDNEERQK